MLDEGDTVTQEIETEHFGEGHIDTITETTVTVEHKTTDDLLHKDTGVVATRYEGDMDQDWGGLGPASMPNCNNYFGTGKCGKGTSSSHTTFDQYVDISDFHISDGGALDWELQMHHSQANTTGYFQTKGYNDNVLQWDTGQITLENNQTPTTYSGTYDFAGDLDKVFIRIGGAKNYYFDNVAYTVNYNHITTSVETWIEIVQPGLMEDQITIELIEQYDVATPEEQYQMDEMMEEFDMVMTFDMPTMDYSMEDMEVDIPIELDNINTMMEDYNEGTISYEDVMVDVQEMVEEIQDIGVEVEVSMPSMEEVEEPILETTIEEPMEMEVVEETTTEPVEVVEETKEEPTEEIADVSEDNNMEEIKEEAKEESEPQEKEVANNDVEEEEVDQEEPKKLEVTKQQQKKQDKANQILATIQSQYDPVAQLTTIALVTALGPNIKQYQQQDIMQQMQWYEAEEIYTDKLMADPLGDYISVRSNLQMERMIQQQYE
jgi:dihydroneopterin aldolase